MTRKEKIAEVIISWWKFESGIDKAVEQILTITKPEIDEFKILRVLSLRKFDYTTLLDKGTLAHEIATSDIFKDVK